MLAQIVGQFKTTEAKIVNIITAFIFFFRRFFGRCRPIIDDLTFSFTTMFSINLQVNRASFFSHFPHQMKVEVYTIIVKKMKNQWNQVLFVSHC